MTMASNHDSEERLNNAYTRMLERLRETLDHAHNDALPRLEEMIMQARERAVELDELTHEEAARISEYLQRDLRDAAEFLSRTGHELADWLDFDLGLIEERLRSLFSLMTDETREELRRLENIAREAGHLHTGEVAGLGTLSCACCGQRMRFHKPGHIPPCPKCHGSRFSRVSKRGA